jgi:hypothetical protein
VHRFGATLNSNGATVKLARVIFGLAFAGLTSCSDSGPNGNASGTVSFSFTGGGGGTYNVTGAIPVNASALFTTNWAAGARDDANNTTEVISVRTATASTFDEIVITIPRTTAGSSTIDVNCSANTCADVSFLIGTNSSGSVFQYLCVLETGTIAIGSISSTRASGTFSGTGTCTNGGGTETAFAVTGGSFNVPLVDAGAL